MTARGAIASGELRYTWNPWHGCRRKSTGCLHCYVYRMDERHGRDASDIRKTGDYALPVRRRRDGAYKIPPGAVIGACFTSDFLLEEADDWRPEAWRMMRERSDCEFLFITKRIERLGQCLPPDWGGGYENVTIGCTCENQRTANERLPIFRMLPVCHKQIICEPLLGPIRLPDWLGPWCEGVLAGGESGNEARLCRYDWILDLRRQCVEARVPFTFRQTGANFEKDGRVYRIPRKEQFWQTERAGINYHPTGRNPNETDDP